MLLLSILAMTLSQTFAYFQIEDIPIEHFNFEHGNLQNNAMDIELMPRFQKSIHVVESDEDPKEYFFSSTYSQHGGDYFNGFPSSEESSEEIGDESKERKKREAQEPATSTEENDRSSIVTTLGKPLELDVMEPENITEKSVEGVIVAVENDEKSEKSNFLINDFIRFKRSADTDSMSKDVANLKKLLKDIDEKNKSKPDTTAEDPKSLVEDVPPPHTEKLIMNHRDPENIDEMAREARGATKEQWVKQVYPVRRRDDLDDHSASAAEKEVIRAPRVHFVTQGMSESSSRPEYSRYDRETRSRNLNKELAWNLGRDPYREMEYDYQPRSTRNYVPPSSNSNYRNDRYYRYDSRDHRDTRDPWEDYPTRSRYRDYPEKPYDNYNTNNYNHNNYDNYNSNKGKQRRIIYYATLPEISRTPPNVNLRDKYDYRDRYENRYLAPEPSYQLRKPYTKSRYEENDNRKPQYPLKVSTDVNVREVKKNPEGRVYSEVDRNRFAQNPNYRNERV